MYKTAIIIKSTTVVLMFRSALKRAAFEKVPDELQILDASDSSSRSVY